MATVPELVQRVTGWASATTNVRALVLVGSQARGDARPDSDVDFVFLSTAPSLMANDLTWVSTFGTVRQVAIEDYGKLTSVRVRYEEGPEVEFGIAGLDWPAAEGTSAVLACGFRVLLDRDRLMSDRL